jgi:hypothetical protein
MVAVFLVIPDSPHLTFTFVDSVPGVLRAAKQYGVESRILDLATFDITNHPWRCGGFFDAIITDPPCTLFVGPI